MKGISSRESSPSHQSTTPRRSPDHRTLSEMVLVDDIEFAESMIREWDADADKRQKLSRRLFVGDRVEAGRFLKAVTDLQRAMRAYLKHDSGSEKLVGAQRLMPIAIKRLEKEFFLILSENRKNLDSDSLSSRYSRRSLRSSVTDYIEDEGSEEEPGKTPPRTPPRAGNLSPEADAAADVAMADLRRIAECMISCGYTKECVKIYNTVRRSIVDEALHYLEVEKLNHSKMQKMEWNVLEDKITAWLRAVKTAVRTLFQGEKILCQMVFASSERIAESCFAEICRDAAVNLFSFATNFGKSKKILSPEKMFRTLDLYEAISNLWPEIEAIFWHEMLSPVKAEAVAALTRLGEAVRIMLTQLETAIQKDYSKTFPGGGVHPLTRYVMNFLIFLGDYTGPVSDIISECPVNPHSPLPESYFSSPITADGQDSSAAAITIRVGWLILLLLCKLDGKAAMYNDVALSYLFLANNLNYVVSKVQKSNLGLVMGADWVWQHRAKVNRFLSKYERMGWTKVISSLPPDPTAEIPLQQIKHHFKQFNIAFEEAYRKQTSWLIPDPELRDRVKLSIATLIGPGYRGFYERHRSAGLLESWEDPIVRYAPEDLGNYLSDLFLQTSGSSTTSSHSSHSRR